MKHVLIVGNGLIGQELARQLTELGITSTFFTSKDDRHTFASQIQATDVVFIAISTKDRGEAALGYVMEATTLGHPVVTCEKGALAYHFHTLRRSLPKLGFNAVVGGGCGMLNLLHNATDPINHLFAVVNGTLNFLFSKFNPEIGIDVVLAEAKALGLCEPGADTIEQVMKFELIDILRKMTILSNVVIMDEHATPITPDTFTYSHIDDYDIPDLLKSGKRFVVSMARKKSRPPQPGIWARIDGWVIQGGFVEQKDHDFREFPFPYEANNALQCWFGEDAMSMVIGPGAGSAPTARAMIRDARRLLRNK
jgi:homoserine dehydrogenase